MKAPLTLFDFGGLTMSIKDLIDEQRVFLDQVKPAYTVETLNGKVAALESEMDTAQSEIAATGPGHLWSRSGPQAARDAGRCGAGVDG